MSNEMGDDRHAIREALSNRYDDLRWCNKDDYCHVLAEGLRLALADFDAALAARQVYRSTTEDVPDRHMVAP